MEQGIPNRNRWPESIPRQVGLIDIEPLQNTTYQFTKEYMSGIQEWNLMLVSEKETLRDGPFNGGSYYKNTWPAEKVTAAVLHR
jgi:hypothetical protein